MNNARLRRQKLVSEINITPFTDVILVLLVIFMVATPLLVQSNLRVNLPQAKSGAKARAELFGLMRGLKPPSPSASSFSAACRVVPFQKKLIEATNAIEERLSPATVASRDSRPRCHLQGSSDATRGGRSADFAPFPRRQPRSPPHRTATPCGHG